MKPRIFIGSSKEGLEISEHIQILLDKHCEVTIWSQGVFGLNKGTLDALVLAVDKFDFAILVLTPDDMTTSREKTLQSPRDNVLFELGLFVGGLGRDRTFIVYNDSKEIKIPSDLAGITCATFQVHSNGDLLPSLGAPIALIKRDINRLGIRQIQQIHKLNTATDAFELTNDRMKKLIELIARSRKVELEIFANQFGQFINKEYVDQIRIDLEELKTMI